MEEHPCNGQSSTHCPAGILALLTASCVRILNGGAENCGTDRNFKCLFQWILSLVFWFLISSVTSVGGGWVEMYPFQQSLMSSWLQAQSHRLAREPTGCLQNKSHQHNPHTLARKQARFLGPLVTTPTRTFQQPLPPLLVPHCRSKQEQCLSENACRRQQKPMRSRVFCSSANV